MRNRRIRRAEEERAMLIDGLKRLEYRGYDSAGVAIMNGKGVETRKAKGKISELEQAMQREPARRERRHRAHALGDARSAERDATRTRTTTARAPCRSCTTGSSRTTAPLRAMLQKTGHTFVSETDTEVLAHLIEAAMDGNLEEAVIDALALVEGTYGIAVISSKDPDKIVAARQGQPAAHRARRRQGEYFVASDVAAILAAHAPGRVSGRRRDGGADARGLPGAATWTRRRVKKGVSRIDWDLDQIEKGGFDHFMLKEIFEQPQTIENTMRGRLVDRRRVLEARRPEPDDGRAAQLDRIIITACGTSWHAALVGEYDDRGARAHPRRGRVRVRVPLPQSDRRPTRRCAS